MFVYSISITSAITDEVKLSKLDETNPIEDNLDSGVAQTEIKKKLREERRGKLETNRNRLRLKNSIEQKHFECSDCGDVFKSSKM